MPHTAYSTAKFAVKGFSEALIETSAMNAPHVKVAVVMPGHIGTDIVANTTRVLHRRAAADAGRSPPTCQCEGPASAGEAATIILDGVRNDEWRILVGDDAKELDAFVRANPESDLRPCGTGQGPRLMRGRSPCPLRRSDRHHPD